MVIIQPPLATLSKLVCFSNTSRHPLPLPTEAHSHRGYSLYYYTNEHKALTQTVPKISFPEVGHSSGNRVNKMPHGVKT